MRVSPLHKGIDMRMVLTSAMAIAVLIIAGCDSARAAAVSLKQ
jgi:hypothetical protein